MYNLINFFFSDFGVAVWKTPDGAVKDKGYYMGGRNDKDIYKLDGSQKSFIFSFDIRYFFKIKSIKKKKNCILINVKNPSKTFCFFWFLTPFFFAGYLELCFQNFFCMGNM